MFRRTLFVALLVVSVGCAKGRTVPETTPLVTFDQTEDLTFLFGSDSACTDGVENNLCESGGDHITYPTVEITLEAFAIDEHEVTNLQYVHCVAHGACSEPKYGNTAAFGGLQSITKYYDDKGNSYDNHPVVNVTHNQAVQYCNFVGKRLPTEFEWELAATSERSLETQGEDTTNDTIYPWNSKLLSECTGKKIAVGKCNADYGLPQAVKSMDDDVVYNGETQIYDMAGNVREWVSDPWDDDITCDKSDTSVPECAGGVAACLGVCTDDASNRYACTPYDPKNEPYGASAIKYAANEDFAYRGASYLTADLCKASTTYRPKPLFVESINKSNLDLGFRCACTVGNCPD